MGIRIVINLSVKSGSGDAFAAAWSPEYDRVNQEDGCKQFELFRSTRNPDNFAVIEYWETREAFDTHWAIQMTRPRAGAEFRDAPANRKVGKSSFEIYWEAQPYLVQGVTLMPAD